MCVPSELVRTVRSCMLFQGRLLQASPHYSVFVGRIDNYNSVMGHSRLGHDL